MQFRVAKTSGAAHVAREFRYNSGSITSEMVNEAARTAKILDLQKQLRTAYNRHDAKIPSNKVELERLTLEAIEGGLTDKAQREHPGFANMQKYDIFVNFFKLPTRTLPKNLF